MHVLRASGYSLLLISSALEAGGELQVAVGTGPASWWLASKQLGCYHQLGASTWAGLPLADQGRQMPGTAFQAGDQQLCQ